MVSHKKTQLFIQINTLNYTTYYTLHPKTWIVIQINSKIDVRVRSATNIII